MNKRTRLGTQQGCENLGTSFPLLLLLGADGILEDLPSHTGSLLGVLGQEQEGALDDSDTHVTTNVRKEVLRSSHSSLPSPSPSSLL
jgi:hypothetical protein